MIFDNIQLICTLTIKYSFLLSFLLFIDSIRGIASTAETPIISLTSVDASPSKGFKLSRIKLLLLIPNYLPVQIYPAKNFSGSLTLQGL